MQRTATTDTPAIDVSELDFSGLLEGGIILLAALVLWLVARFLISKVVARAQKGSTLLRSQRLRWAQPVMRNLDNKRRVQRADTIGALLRSSVSVAIWTVAIIMVLGAVGINIAPLLASVGIVGIALGFGAREVIRDALAGLFISLEDQYGIGDVIEVGDTTGTVQSVGIRITRLVDERGVIWYIRNGEFAKVGNRSQGNYVPQAEPTVTAVQAAQEEGSK